MKKIYLLLALCVSTLAAQADVYEVTLANAQWNFDDATITTNTKPALASDSYLVPSNWYVNNGGSSNPNNSVVPFIYPYNGSTDEVKYGYDSNHCIRFYHQENANRAPIYAVLPLVTDEAYSNLELHFWGKGEASVTSSTYHYRARIGYITSEEDTLRTTFGSKVKNLQDVTFTSTTTYSEHTISLASVPAGAHVVIYDDNTDGANNVFMLDNISIRKKSGSTPTTPATPASYTISYNLTGCTAASANKATVTAEDNELDLFFDLADGFSWSGCTYEVKMGATTLDAETDYLADVDEEQFNIYIYLISGKFNGNITVTLTAKANAAITRPTVFAPATFEDITIATNSVYRPVTFSVGHNQWLSGSFICNTYMGSASYFSDIQVANYAGSFTPSGSDEYLACAAGCAAQGNNYAIWNASMDYTTYAANNQQIDLCVPTTLSGMAITCDEHAVNSILNGDSYCTKFKQDDWFMVKIIGWNSGVQTGNIDFYLADFRTAGNWVIAENWQWVNLTTLGVVDHLSFEMYSTDTSYGYMNTPAYFCFDNLGGQASDCTLGAMTKVGGTATNLDNINESTVEKLLLNNQVVIRRGDKLYNVSGQLIR